MASRVLHTEIDEPCACCGLTSTFVFRSQTDQQVCERCQRHGSDASKQVAVHRDLVKRFVQAQREDRVAQRRESSEALAAAKRETANQEMKTRSAEDRTAAILATIRKGYAGPDSDRVRKWVRDSLVREAEWKRDGAYRARELAFGALLEIQRQHRADADTDACTCGRPLERCEVQVSVNRVARALERWEQVQIERLQKGYEHSLPDGHPAIQKHRGIGSGYRFPVNQEKLNFDDVA